MLLAVEIDDSLLVKALLPAVGLLLIITALMFSIRKKRARAADRLSPREQLERSRQEAGMRRDLETLMVEIEQLAKRLGAQLDAKTMAVERLLAEADEKLRRLESAGSSGGGISGEPASPSVAASGDGVERESQTATEVAREAERVYALADEGLDALAIAQRLDEHVGKVELMLALRQTR